MDNHAEYMNTLKMGSGWNEEEDNKLYTIGNCFQTKEDAEIALEMVKELLSSLHGENEKTKTYKCKNCKSTNTELLKTKPWQYYICKNCNMIYQTEESKREERKLEKEKAK